jgi:hypothetical protein
MSVWSENYWEKRYLSGGISGSGSMGLLAAFKAKIINSVAEELLATGAIEFGCGDGYQLGMFKFERYLGLDPSISAIQLCKKMYDKDPTKRFKILSKYDTEKDDVSLSLDVIFHLVEDDIFYKHLQQLFVAARKAVIIYSSNFNAARMYHERHRCFSEVIDQLFPKWELRNCIINEFPYGQNKKIESVSRSNFYIYTSK